MVSKWRPLNSAQIAKLTAQGCSCAAWSQVLVGDDFNPDRIKNTIFSGDVRLGNFQNDVRFSAGLSRPSGIYNASIHNCSIGDNVFISNIKNYIANYTIGDDCVIENVDLLAVDGLSSFGNGSQALVINEAGGREIPIFDNLSAQLAYIIALYRHKPVVIEKVWNMIFEYVKSVTASMGVIANASKITNTRIIKNVKVGLASVIEAADYLENGSINSSPVDPVYIGPAVSAKNFIVSSGAKIFDSVILNNCFVGQAVEIAKQFSAENSVFFANCACFHGEACSVFAGPFTVSHHKSTLLIAGLYSFLNAGSGTNFSNHMYKLGPVHQGIVERGCKTASDSYTLWPARVGAFSVLLGKNYQNSDTSDLPFSYLLGHDTETFIYPGVNLKSVGTIRDAKKWPRRDNRKDPRKLDLINFKLLTPYTVRKMLNASKILRNLESRDNQNNVFTYHYVKIRKESLEKGIRLYEIGIDKFLGACLISRLDGRQFSDIKQLRAALKPQAGTGPGKWADLAGLLVPEEIITGILDDISSGKLSSIEQIEKTLLSAHENYSGFEWAWAANVLQQRLGKTIDALTPDDIINMVERYKFAVVDLDNMLIEDAKKEFSPAAKVGYGIDSESPDTDFAHVRGTPDNNEVIIEIQKHTNEKSLLADGLIRRIRKLS